MNADAETVIPLLPCRDLGVTLGFYRALGFTITHEQASPYVYGAASLNAVHLRFSTLAPYGAKRAFGAALVLMDSVRAHHESSPMASAQPSGASPRWDCRASRA